MHRAILLVERSRSARGAVDPAVGLAEVLGIGEWTGPDRPFALVCARSDEAAARAARRIEAALTLADVAPAAPPILIDALERETCDL